MLASSYSSPHVLKHYQIFQVVTFENVKQLILTFFLHVTAGFLNITLTSDVNGIEDVDSAVLTCSVDTTGINAGNGLLFT